MASRAELVQQVIRPALAGGHVVVCDRFLLATVVYQGHAGGLNVETLWKMGELATGGLAPDLTLVFDLPVEMATQRRGRDADRMESRDRMYHERVRAGFLAEAKRQPDVIQVIDATPMQVRFMPGCALSSNPFFARPSNHAGTDAFCTAQGARSRRETDRGHQQD